MAFAKLDCGITKSSVWSEPLHVRVVWISFLAEKDENGFVHASRSGMVRVSNVTDEQFDDAVLRLESPDPDSRTPDNQGRRIMKVEGGWLVLNHDKYRLPMDVQRIQTRERVRKYREKLKENSDVTDGNVTSALASVSVSGSVCESSDKDLPKEEDLSTKPEYQRLIDYWQSCKNTITHTTITPKMEKIVKDRLKEYVFNDLGNAVFIYDKMMGSGRDFYGRYNHRLDAFFRDGVNKNAPFVKFLTESKPDGLWKKDKTEEDYE